MPMVEDHCIGAEILLLGGDKIASGHVMTQSNDANGNVMGRTHMNPILDTKMYEAEFAGGEVTELTANVIVESTYIQCGAEGN